MAANKDQFCYSKSDKGPDMFLGLVQAGSTQAIKAGELCVFNKTTGYWVPASAVADGYTYPLALSAEEQKSSGRGELTGARYMSFYSLSPDDVFEFELAAARDLLVGDKFTLTASDSQSLTYTAGAFAVAVNVVDNNYPQEEDTDIRSQSYARVTFNPACTWYGFKKSLDIASGRKVIPITATATMLENQMYNSLILISGTTTITLPAVKPGMDAIFVNIDGATQSINPNDSDKIRLDGALLDDGDSITQTTIAFSCNLVTEGADGFICLSVPAQWTDGS